MGFHRRCEILQWGEVRLSGERAVKIFNEQWLLQGRRRTEEKPQAAAKSFDVVTAMNPKLSLFFLWWL